MCIRDSTPVLAIFLLRGLRTNWLIVDIKFLLQAFFNFCFYSAVNKAENYTLVDTLMSINIRLFLLDFPKKKCRLHKQSQTPRQIFLQNMDLAHFQSQYWEDNQATI